MQVQTSTNNTAIQQSTSSEPIAKNYCSTAKIIAIAGLIFASLLVSSAVSLGLLLSGIVGYYTAIQIGAAGAALGTAITLLFYKSIAKCTEDTKSTAAPEVPPQPPTATATGTSTPAPAPATGSSTAAPTAPSQPLAGTQATTPTTTTAASVSAGSGTGPLTFPDSDTPLRGDRLGLPIEEYHKALPVISDQTRKEVVEDTLNMVNYALKSNDKETQENLHRVVLIKDPGSTFARPSHILGRYDVLATPCRMDYNFNWQRLRGDQKPFWVHHGAAINIGESASAEDFNEFQVNGSLDEDKYIEAMKHIFTNMLDSQRAHVEHAVWIPFGMGAFLRNLPQNDPAYTDVRKMRQLRDRLAETFVNLVEEKYSDMKIHVCLPTDSSGTDFGTNQNHNAFIKALARNPAAANHFKVYVNVDATDLAQRLANQHGDYRISLANAANRNLLGNRWYHAGSAKRAIDENLHRRSYTLSITSMVLNDANCPDHGQPYPSRPAGYLAQRVRDVVGTVR